MDQLRFCRFLKSNTVKKKVFKIFCYICFSLKIDWVFSRDVDSSTKQAITAISAQLDLDLYYILSTKPTDSERSRSYIFLVSKKKNKSDLFVKVTFDKRNRLFLKREYEALQFLESRQDLDFKFPTTHYFHEEKDLAFLIMNMLSPDARMYNQEMYTVPKCIDTLRSINQNNISNADLDQLQWWKDFIKILNKKKQIGLSNFHKALLECLTEEDNIKLSAVHGDLGSENTYKEDDGSLTIIDWERFSKEGPYLTDYLGWWLGKIHKTIFRDRRRAQLVFEKEFAEMYRKKDAYLALAFMIAQEFSVALAIVECWE